MHNYLSNYKAKREINTKKITKTKRNAFTKRMCAHLGQKTDISKNKSQKNEQKDVKRTQNYRKINKIIRKSSENNEI